MYQAYKYRAYPTKQQKESLARSFGCCRWLWNFSLNLCQQTYKETGKSLSRYAIQSKIPELKKEYPWLTDAYSQCLQVVALNLSTAYKNFFEKRARLPRFKSKHGRQSISYPQGRKLEGNYLKLDQKIGSIYCRIHRRFTGKIKTVTVSLEPDGKYYASILVDDGKETPKVSSVGKAVGIDLGLTDFAITSDGSKFDNPKHFAKHYKNLKRKQQKLARKKKGSNRRGKARKKVAKVHSKISRCREDFLHKLSRKLVDENQVIAVENLLARSLAQNTELGKRLSPICGAVSFRTRGRSSM